VQSQACVGGLQQLSLGGEHRSAPGPATKKQLQALQQLSSHEGQHSHEQRIAWAVLAVVASDLWRAATEVAVARPPAPQLTQQTVEPHLLVEPYHVLQWLYRSAVNSFGLTSLLLPSYQPGPSQPVRCYGRGVFPQAAAFNHSCTPNVSIRFNGTTLTARATGALKPGQQAFISYGG
jgi:hypothetical protein